MRSIRTRLALGLVAGLALLLGAGGAALYFRTKVGLERQDDEALLAKAWALASAVRVDESEIQFEPAPALSTDFERTDRRAFYEIRHRDGRVFAQSHSMAGRGLSLPTSIGREPAFAWISIEEGRPAREVGLRIPVLSEESDPHLSGADGAPVRAMLDEFSISVAEDVADTQATLAGLRTSILAVITLAFLMSILLVQFVLKRGLSPLEAMAAEAQKIDAESLDRRFSKAPLPSELEPIRTRLNDLLDRLQQSFERERRFNAAVAHELRTPIAELRALSEIALRWPESADAKKNMTDVSAVAREMQSIVEALLTLRRVESGAEKVELEPVRVDELLYATLTTYEKAAVAREQRLTLKKVASNVTIDSHAPMLRSIVSNLVSNAIDYAPKGSTIEIACSVDNGRFRLSTKNPAPDLTTEDVRHLFEPFWRKDSVRTTGSHAGLGLTLTQSLSKVLDLEVRAELVGDGSLEIILESRSGSSSRSVPAGSATSVRTHTPERDALDTVRAAP